MKIIACYIPLSEVSATNVAEAENLDEAEKEAEVVRMVGGDEVLSASKDEGHVSSVDGPDNYVGGDASDNENLWTYIFGASTITIGRIKEMVEKGYFTDGDARVPRAESMSESDDNEAIVHDDFFVAGLRKPPLPALADILLKF
jgi:hypothetical protein